MSPVETAVGIVVLIPLFVLVLWLLWLLVTAPFAAAGKIRERHHR